MSKTSLLLEAALWYATKKGWPVLPLHSIRRNGLCTCSKAEACENPGKHPRWQKDTLEHGAKDATTDPEQIRKWFEKWPEANVGIATGDQSFDVVDVDLKGDGPDTLRELELKHGDLPDTIEQITGSGGRQIMFQPTRGRLTNAVKFASGLDIRTNGGLVVVPPSRHISGGKYEWEASSLPNKKALAPFPDWIIRLVNQSSGRPAGNGSGVDVDAIWAGIKEGERDRELYRYVCRLRAQNVSRQEAEILVLAAAGKCVPPFPSDDALRKVEQAWKHPLGGDKHKVPPGVTIIEHPGGIVEWVHPDTSVTDDRSSCSPDTSEWEPEVLEWPILPKAAEHGMAGDFVELATSNSEADPAAVLVTFLARFAAEIGNGPHLMVGDTKHPARMFTAIVGATSKARKGTSHGPVDRLFKGLFRFTTSSLLGNYAPARSTPGPLSSGEGLIFAVRDPVEKLVRDKKTGETHLELVDQGVSDKRLFVIDEELGGAISCTRREGNTLSTVLRCSWDHGNLDPLTKTSKITATEAHICVVGHITRAELRQKLQETETLSGFSNRFLWVCSRRNGCVPFPEPIPEDALRAIQRRLFDIIRTAQGIQEMTLSSEARQLWYSVYAEISSDHDGLVGAVINRAEAQVLRLSMIYALLDQSDTIDREHLTAALSFWDYSKKSAEYVFHGFEADPVADKILKKAQEDGQVEWKELYALFSNNVPKGTIDAAVNELIRKGKVKLETVKKVKKDRGRPRRLLVAEVQKKDTANEVNEENEINQAEHPEERITSLTSFTSSRDILCDPDSQTIELSENEPEDFEVF
jgi:hypothetical protein